MAARTFSLAGLLRLRGMAEDRAAGRLAQTRAVRGAAATQLARAESDLAASGMPDGADVRLWQAGVAGRAALGALLGERRVQLVAADDEVAVAQEAWTLARRETRAVERLAERHAEQVRAEDLRAEQLVLDEIAGRAPAGGGTDRDDDRRTP
ncbi:flagellar export protein FliJ [Cellulomonas marina]|uniref:Flagellar FliJ protein n=1 Tax=Cellulomonas marina TaxID=988821 RepID=A0A1I0WHD9_9CELL|nr:flagellar export protein FliJ [Cellulomonas marina]GIG27659.1 hypothetical protein Cma02nite_02590 [Cellulomonas marina]SFA88159.1 flagellar FliJ protein [Cellulomonas marina]